MSAYEKLLRAAESIGFVSDEVKDQLESIAAAIENDPRTEEDEDKKGDTFMVDIPDPHDLSAGWVELGSFETRQAALDFVKETFGSDDGTIDLISRIETDEDEGW